MPVDPKHFEGWTYPSGEDIVWPKAGQLIEWVTVQGETGTDRVARVSMLIEPVIFLLSKRVLFPTLGDRFHVLAQESHHSDQ